MPDKELDKDIMCLVSASVCAIARLCKRHPSRNTVIKDKQKWMYLSTNHVINKVEDCHYFKSK